MKKLAQVLRELSAEESRPCALPKMGRHRVANENRPDAQRGVAEPANENAQPLGDGR